MVIAYRQERFIREAVRSALAQTYEPLEIILSDDCSPDGTFEIMKEEASAYRGPHTIVLNRNPTNCGLAQHHNRAWALCHGEFIVAQAGDDISVPHRTTSLVRAWRSPTPVDLVCSDVCVVDDSNRVLSERWQMSIVASLSLEDALATGIAFVLGCTAGYSRRLTTAYDAIDPAVLQEDNVLPFRALLGAGIRVIDEPLVRYRQHSESVWHGMTRAPRARPRELRRKLARNRHAIAREWLTAWDATGRPDNAGRHRLVELERLWRYDAAGYDLSRMQSLFEAKKAFWEGLSLRKTGGLIKRHVFRYPP